MKFWPGDISRATGTASRREDGQLLIVAAAVLSLMVVVLGLVVDVGLEYGRHRTAQKAADAAAEAGAIALVNFGTSKATADAMRYAKINGFNNDGTTNTVTVNIPPVAAWSGRSYNSEYVQVIITEKSNTYFSRLLNIMSFGSKVQAIAWSSLRSNYALLLLDRNASPGLGVDKSDVLAVNGGNVAVNSGVTVGNGALDNAGSLTAQYRIDAVGTCVNTGYMSPPCTHISQPVADPFATAPRPWFDPSINDFRGPDGTPLIVQSGTYSQPATLNALAGTNYDLHPGVYYGGINQTANTSSITMEPGLYVISGGGGATGNSGGFQLNNGTATGIGVTIYNTGDPGALQSNDKNPGRLYLTGNGAVNLQAPTSGIYSGLLYFQDPNDTVPITIIGGGNLSLVGSIYAPRAEVDLQGNGNAVLTVQMVVDKMLMSGNPNFTINMPTNFYKPPGMTLVE